MEKSSWQDVRSGVPEGSIIGSLLFLIYVNDFPRSISSHVASYSYLLIHFYKGNNVQLQAILDNPAINGVTYGNSILILLNAK